MLVVTFALEADAGAGALLGSRATICTVVPNGYRTVKAPP